MNSAVCLSSSAYFSGVVTGVVPLNADAEAIKVAMMNFIAEIIRAIKVV